MNKFLISFLLAAFLFNVYVSSQSILTDWVDPNRYCTGNTTATCRSPSACCFWFTNSTAAPLSKEDTSNNGTCVYLEEFVNCPVNDIAKYAPVSVGQVLTASCTCDLRNTRTNSPNSSSAIKSINSLSFLSIFIISISTLLFTSFISFN